MSSRKLQRKVASFRGKVPAWVGPHPLMAHECLCRVEENAWTGHKSCFYLLSAAGSDRTGRGGGESLNASSSDYMGPALLHLYPLSLSVTITLSPPQAHP